MAHLLQSLQDYFVLEEINIDSWSFKLYYKVSCAMCMLGATIGVASQYFGDPISCDFEGLDGDLAQDYCWIHGSAYIPRQYQAHMKCIVAQDRYSNREDAPETSFYQWVTFMLVLQAAVFYLPYKVWGFLEGGLVASFGHDGKTPVMISLEARYDDGVVMEVVVEKFVKYFKSIFHHNTWYFVYYVTCELSNYALLVAQIYFTDLFLDQKFAWYGYETVVFYSHGHRARNSPRESGLTNPMCSMFPTEVSCVIPNIGAAGEGQFHNGLCVLTQNIVNEKIYLVIWFWFAFLVPCSILSMFYRIVTIFFESVRFSLIYKTIRHKYDKDVRKCLQYVLAKSQIGDWFVLYQLCKNSNPYFFREFIRELAIDLKHRPKMSKSNGTLSPPALTLTGAQSPPGAAQSPMLPRPSPPRTLPSAPASLPRDDRPIAV